MKKLKRDEYDIFYNNLYKKLSDVDNRLDRINYPSYDNWCIATILDTIENTHIEDNTDFLNNEVFNPKAEYYTKHNLQYEQESILKRINYKKDYDDEQAKDIDQSLYITIYDKFIEKYIDKYYRLNKTFIDKEVEEWKYIDLIDIFCMIDFIINDLIANELAYDKLIYQPVDSMDKLFDTALEQIEIDTLKETVLRNKEKNR